MYTLYTELTTGTTVFLKASESLYFLVFFTVYISCFIIIVKYSLYTVYYTVYAIYYTVYSIIHYTVYSVLATAWRGYTG